MHHSPFNVHLFGEIGVGGIGAALAGTAVGSLLLLAYIIGGMGAGDVKMCMGFGAWVGAFYGITGPDDGSGQGQALWIILYAQFAGIIVGGVIGLVMILLRMEFKKNVEHARSIVMDAVTTGSIGKMAERANERRPRWHRLPYGVPMCIGFLGYLWMMEPKLNEPPVEPKELATACLVCPAPPLASNSVLSPE
jgi:prepilin peptidase CpaA